MGAQNVFDRVLKRLREVEMRHGVRVLYACESGSRAWGFSSSDSDYDVRFLYVRPRDCYLSVEQGRDVIEEPLSEELDVSGWNLRKALRLLRKSNPSLMEWLNSPVVYAGESAFREQLYELAVANFSPAKCFHHYRSMAVGNTRRNLARDQVRPKKYLYTLRPLLACRWVEQELRPPAIQLDQLVASVLPELEVREALDRLVTAKRLGREFDAGPRIEVLDRFIEGELQRLFTVGVPEAETVEAAPLDEFFRHQLN